jgi:replicative DNA helicase
MSATPRAKWTLSSLLPEIERLPPHWALVPVGGNKRPPFSEWESSRFAIANFKKAEDQGFFADAWCKKGTPEAFNLPARFVTAVGVLCGEPSGGLLFFDHDGSSADAKILELSECETLEEALPVSPMVTSQRPGRYQIIYQVPEIFWTGIATAKVGTAFEERIFGTDGTPKLVPIEGIEFRWNGAQSVVIGQHPDTDGYKWIRHPSSVPIAEAPIWMIQQMLIDEVANPPEGSYSNPNWIDFDRNFRVPTDIAIPLTVVLAPRTRKALDGEFQSGRNDTGAAIARDLIGTSNHLTSIGQSFTGDAQDIFLDWCRRTGLDRDTPKGQPESIWKQAERSNPGPSLNLSMIEGCIKAWVWKEQASRQAPVQQEQASALPSRRGQSIVQDFVGTREPVLAPTELSASDLKNAVQEYAAEIDPFERVLKANKIARDYGLRGKALANLVAHATQGLHGGTQSAQEISISVLTDMESRSTSRELLGLPTGFHDLDAMTQGLQGSDLILLAARPAMGKTALAEAMALAIASLGSQVIFYSLEMSKQQLIYRFLSIITGIEMGRLRQGRLTENEWGEVSSAMELLSDIPLLINDQSYLTVELIRDEVLAMERKPALVIIDYLTLLNGYGDSSVEIFSNISKDLKRLAKEFNVPILALSQLNRAVESRTNKRPTIADIRETGAIEQDCDLIFMLYRDEYYNPDSSERGIAELIVTKHRNGPTGTIKLLFQGECMRFRNLSRPARLG